MSLGRTLVKTLLCLSLCLCNGAPLKEAAGKSPSGPRYTDKEDALIISELLSIPGDYIPTHGTKVWENIAQKIAQKWREGTDGFPQERTSLGIRKHFNNYLVRNYPESTVKVPSALMKKCGKTGSKQAYILDEENVIIQELSKINSSILFSSPTLEAVHAALARKRKSTTPGTSTERSMTALRKHLFDMKKNGKLPDNLLKKFQFLTNDKGAGSSQATRGNAQTEVQDTMQELTDAEILEMVDELLNKPNCVLDYSRIK